MTDFTNSKLNPNGVFPENAIDGKEWSRTQPVLGVDQLKMLYLTGIDLVSQTKNRITGKYDVITDDMLKEFILDAIASVETQFMLDILPVTRAERHPFDRNFMNNYGYFRVQHHPILSVEQIAIKPSSGPEVFIIPKEWVNTGYYSKGQINLWPVGPATFVESTGTSVGGGALVLTAIDKAIWQPQIWEVKYTSGMPEGAVPRIINQAIGCQAAIDVCNALAAMNPISSYSLGIDGMSQSQSTPGPQKYAVKIAEMKERLAKIEGKIKGMYGNGKWAFGTI